MAQRIHRHIPEDSNPLQEKFINYIMLDGKKSIARTIFKDVMDEIKKKGHKNPETIFEKAIEMTINNTERIFSWGLMLWSCDLPWRDKWWECVVCISSY